MISRPCGCFSLPIACFGFRAGQLPVRADVFGSVRGVWPFVRAFFNPCGQSPVPCGPTSSPCGRFWPPCGHFPFRAGNYPVPLPRRRKAAEGRRSPRRFARAGDDGKRASVLECASPLVLWPSAAPPALGPMVLPPTRTAGKGSRRSAARRAAGGIGSGRSYFGIRFCSRF